MPFGQLPTPVGIFVELFEEFLPEIWKALWRRFRKSEGGGTSESGASASSRHLQDRMNETLEGIAAYFAKIPVVARQKLDDALKLMNENEQDAAERALGRMLGQLKNGIFPPVMHKITEPVTIKVKNRKGQPHDIVKSRTTETTKEKPGWDPGQIFVKALTNAGKSRESAARFWKMMLQTSPIWRSMQRLAGWFSGRERSRSLLCWVTRTRRGKRAERNLTEEVTPQFRDETDEEMTIRALRRLGKFIFGVVLATVVVAFLAIPFLFYKLIFGSVAAEAGVGGMLAGVLWPAFLIAVLSIVGVAFLRLWGFRAAHRKYFAVLCFLVAVGLGVRLLSLFFTLGDHPLLSPAAILAIAILAWNGVARRIMREKLAENETPLMPGRLQRTLSATATVILVGAIVGMMPSHFDAFVTWLESGQKRVRTVVLRHDKSTIIDPETGKVLWCRQDLSGIENREWPENLPDNTPRKFRCNDLGVDLASGFPAVPLSPEDIFDLAEWEKKREEVESETEVATIATHKTTPWRRHRDGSIRRTIVVPPHDLSPEIHLGSWKSVSTKISDCAQIAVNGMWLAEEDCPEKDLLLDSFIGRPMRGKTLQWRAGPRGVTIEFTQTSL